jgi:hypothetical protein
LADIDLTSTEYYIYGQMTHTINRKRLEMANTGVKNGKNLKTKPAKLKKPPRASDWFEAHPDKKLSKAGEWLKAHPGGICKILDMRAVMK